MDKYTYKCDVCEGFMTPHASDGDEFYLASDVDRILDICRGEINEERQDVDRFARRIAELEKALRDLSSAHSRSPGYQLCICAAHEAARKALGL